MEFETLITRGRILTMDPARPQVEAVAVAGDRVVYDRAQDGDAAVVGRLPD